METIVYKYELEIGVTKIQAPSSALPIYVGVQNEKPFIWMTCLVGEKTTEWVFEVVGTGQRFKHFENAFPYHVGSFMLNEGAFVGHVFRA